MALAALVAGLCLSGCSLDATVVIHPDDSVDVDVTTWEHQTAVAVDADGNETPSTTPPCPFKSLAPELRFEELTRPDRPTTVGCHVTGTTRLSSMGLYGTLGHVGDRYFLSTWVRGALNDASSVAPAPARPAYLSVTFPGPVESHDAGAEVTGNTVTWADLTGAATPPKISAVALAPDAPGAILPVLGGLAVGTATVAGAALTLRRRSSTKTGKEPS